MTNEQEQLRNPFEQGPYIQVACICEKVLVEQDGVKSAIRIVDRVIVTTAVDNPPEEMEPYTANYFFLIKLIAGSTRGTNNLELQLQKPSGESRTPQRIVINFEGDDNRPVDITGPLRVTFDMPGLYWLDIFFNGSRLSRMPLSVVYLPQSRTGSTPPDNPPPSGDNPSTGDG